MPVCRRPVPEPQARIRDRHDRSGNPPRSMSSIDCAADHLVLAALSSGPPLTSAPRPAARNGGGRRSSADSEVSRRPGQRHPQRVRHTALSPSREPRSGSGGDRCRSSVQLRRESGIVTRKQETRLHITRVAHTTLTNHKTLFAIRRSTMSVTAICGNEMSAAGFRRSCIATA